MAGDVFLYETLTILFIVDSKHSPDLLSGEGLLRSSGLAALFSYKRAMLAGIL
jgi:hypothetical protein